MTTSINFVFLSLPLSLPVVPEVPGTPSSLSQSLGVNLISMCAPSRRTCSQPVVEVGLHDVTHLVLIGGAASSVAGREHQRGGCSDVLCHGALSGSCNPSQGLFN
ncbi:hypothetical protein EYF80_011683 [Liparis tanakae]|uniref:Secreted protein n=1 Tax=Liparis tanakae TaxID=230148 RepID=A0A4Z2IK31_9TELE|nr:hypothetical protein EYF80_011683 [Liparis tanakae]